MDAEEMIFRDALALKTKLRGGTIYGVPLDMDNPNMMMLAAYFYGRCNNLPEIDKDVVVEQGRTWWDVVRGNGCNFDLDE